MSRANRIGKELARERAALMRAELELRAQRNRRTAVYGSSFGVVLLALVLSIVITGALQPTTPPTTPLSTVADTSGGITSADAYAIPVGQSSAPVKLSVYEDFRCSACSAYESKYQTAYKALISAGTLQLLVHPVDLIDNSEGGSGSLAAGNAAACAQDVGKFQAYHDLLYANQPAEKTDSFSSSSTLINYAKQVSGLDSPTFESCVKSGKYDDWIKQNYRNLEAIDGQHTATPTLLVNGTAYTLTTPDAFTAFVQQAAATATAAAKASASAAASASGTATAAASASASASGSASASSSAAPSASASAASSASASASKS